MMEPRVKDNAVVNDHPPIAAANLKPIFGGPVIAAGGFDGKSRRRSSAKEKSILWSRSVGTSSQIPTCRDA